MNVSYVHICHLGVSHLHSARKIKCFIGCFSRNSTAMAGTMLECSGTEVLSFHWQLLSAARLSQSHFPLFPMARAAFPAAEETVGKCWGGKVLEGKDQPICWAAGLGELEVCAQQFLLWSSISSPGLFWCLNSAGVWSWAGSTLTHLGVEHTEASLWPTDT